MKEIKSYSGNELQNMNADYFKRLDASYQPWRLEFWKQRFMFGYWLVIIVLMITVWTCGILFTGN